MTPMKSIATTSVRAAADAPAYRNEISAGPHRLVADEPVSAGGQARGPAPYDFILAGLGACTVMTLTMYAERKGWALGDIDLDLRLLKDAEGATHIERDLRCSAALSDDQWARLLDICSKTPVTRTLMAGAAIRTQRLR
jgi:putative redox protein